MKVRVESSRILKPLYGGDDRPRAADATEHVPLTPFDRVTDDAHIAVLFAYRPPTPPNSVLVRALAVALAAYREWAGRLSADGDGKPVILLNDAGVRLVEAYVDAPHDACVSPDPSPSWLALHPSPDEGPGELLQVQLTRFACGALVVGFTMYHRVADGPATTQFLVDWCRAARGAPVRPPARDRAALCAPRDPPAVEFEHLGTELASERFPAAVEEEAMATAARPVATQKVHFSEEFLARLKQAAGGAGSTFECVVAHVWRAMTRARGLPGGETTRVRISVDGRHRMRPPLPREYFGNVILWAYPRAKARDLTAQPLRYAVDLIRGEIARVGDRYFKSFIDFAASEAAEGLVSTVDPDQWVLKPNVDVDSWLRFPIRELDIGGSGGGGGCPFYFVPSYYPVEGLMFLVPSSRGLVGEGRQSRSIDAYVSLFEEDMDVFRRICYSLDDNDDHHHHHHHTETTGE